MNLLGLQKNIRDNISFPGGLRFVACSPTNTVGTTSQRWWTWTCLTSSTSTATCQNGELQTTPATWWKHWTAASWISTRAAATHNSWQYLMLSRPSRMTMSQCWTKLTNAKNSLLTWKEQIIAASCSMLNVLWPVTSPMQSQLQMTPDGTLATIAWRGSYITNPACSSLSRQVTWGLKTVLKIVWFHGHCFLFQVELTIKYREMNIVVIVTLQVNRKSFTFPFSEYLNDWTKSRKLLLLDYSIE